MSKKETRERKKTSTYQIFSDDSDKVCPYCGQSLIPFKLGVCVCGKQIGNIQYVKNPKKFAKNYYSYKTEKDYASAQ